MRDFFAGVVSFVLEAVCTPRATAALVERLTLADLQTLLLSPGQRGLLPYHDPTVTALVWELKYHANRKAAALAGALLGEALLTIAAEELGSALLVPVPMHRKRRKARGHNQCELLCAAALQASDCGLEYLPAALERTANRAPQQSLPRHQRLTNVRGTMEATPVVAGRVCIVVDDVATTGTTLAEAKRALKAAGARRVHCLALAQS